MKSITAWHFKNDLLRRIIFMRGRINLNYSCINEAGHNYICCETCWNSHPDKTLHYGKISSDEFMVNYRKARINNIMIDGKIAGFNNTQLEFLIKEIS
jgi:hypothetical protein